MKAREGQVALHGDHDLLLADDDHVGFSGDDPLKKASTSVDVLDAQYGSQGLSMIPWDGAWPCCLLATLQPSTE